MGACELCDSTGGRLIWRDERCRVVRVTGAEGEAFPGFCRVIWQRHVAEFADLAASEHRHLCAVLRAAERAVRAVVMPDKVNLASLGNLVPHLHWHVIPRWTDDSHFPAPIWAGAARPVPRRPQPVDAQLTEAFLAALEEQP